MASGKVHDWVTVMLLAPVFAGCRWLLGWDLNAAVWITLGTAIGGLLLSPDLDTRSRPFYRWGVFRFIWWPYQWAIRHRSGLSHGVVFAPFFRCLYLSAVLIVIYFGLFAYLSQDGSLLTPRAEVLGFLRRHLNDLLLLAGGVWVGSLLHVILDAASSALTARTGRRRVSRR